MTARQLRAEFSNGRQQRKKARNGDGDRYHYRHAKNVLLPAKLKADAEKRALEKRLAKEREEDEAARRQANIEAAKHVPVPGDGEPQTPNPFVAGQQAEAAAQLVAA